MRHPRPLPAVACALGLSVLAACGTASAPSPAQGTTAAASAALANVSASGPVDLKTAPTVKLGGKVASRSVERKVLTPGTGTGATKADTVRLRVQIFNGTSGKKLDDGYTAGRPVEGYRLGRSDLIPGFIKGLLGSQKGSRVAFTIPPAEGFGTQGNEQLGVSGTDTIVVVADIADVHKGLTKVDGAQTAAPADLPAVAFPQGTTKAPKVTVPKAAAPKETREATLVQGTGATVAKGQTISVQYHGVLWKDGSVFDSSWERGTPADFPIGVGGVIPAWDKAFVGKKVGSRVLLVVAPKDGYGAQGSPPKISGTDTLVFVVDILDAY